ncbi:MAG: 2-oxo acid dehydrogenase subunit E2 [Actinomycetia bacterium]|nr:2-oxo acid dehydrogenase subunit E2 [Actinomycetes bacterium]
MPTEVTLPALGESITEGTVSRWLKSVGDVVRADEALLEVSTDKVDTEIPAPTSGVLIQIMAGEDQVVKVGQVLGVIGPPGSAPVAAAPAVPVAKPAPAPAATQAAVTVQAPKPASPPVAPVPAAPPPDATAAPPVPTPVVPTPVVPTPVPVPTPAAPPAPAAASRPPASPPAPAPRIWPSTGSTTPPWAASREPSPSGWRKPWEAPGAHLAPAPTAAPAPAPVAPAPAPVAPAPAPAAPVAAEPEPVVVTSEPEPAAAAVPAPDVTVAEPEPVIPDAAEPKAAVPDEPADAPVPPAEPANPAEPEDTSPAEDEPAYVTPLVRQIARELGVDLAAVTGSGVGGRVRKQDILDFAAAHPEALAPPASPDPALALLARGDDPLRGQTMTIPGVLQARAEQLIATWRSSVPLSLTSEADVTGLAGEDAPGVLAQILVALTRTLRAFAPLNAALDAAGGTIVYHATENIGLTMDTAAGPAIPVLHDAGVLGASHIDAWLADIAERAPQGDFEPTELSGGTFTVTAAPTLMANVLVNHPQVAALGIGAPTVRPGVVDGRVVPRTLVYLTLTYNHAIVDTATAGTFLTALKAAIEAGS